MNQTLAPIEELLRIPSPCPGAIGLACDGPNLWISSYETNRIYGLNAQQGTVFEEAIGPGELYGLTVTGDALRVVVADRDDNRTIRRYIMGKDFKSEAIRCPDDSGSFLAYDGDLLYLSQRHQKRIVELDEAGKVLRTIDVPREVTGMVVANGCFYLMTTESRTVNDFRLLCLDARQEHPKVTELASLPYRARGLGYDGTKFWTHASDQNTIVAFAKPG